MKSTALTTCSHASSRFDCRVEAARRRVLYARSSAAGATLLLREHAIPRSELQRRLAEQQRAERDLQELLSRGG